jgi:hypothetical protein
MPINKLKGASQMVANMLKRDNTPVRTEAVEELLNVVADVESGYAKSRERALTQARKADELSDMLEKVTKLWEDRFQAAGLEGVTFHPDIVACVKDSRSLLNRKG